MDLVHKNRSLGGIKINSQFSDSSSKLENHLKKATLIKCYKRFLVDITLEDGTATNNACGKYKAPFVAGLNFQK
jgi:hypothetical protein